jgi:hypothetical protein
MPCQALAKRLLKSDPQDLLLCGVYAQREAASGNMKHARRVFDMALTSICGLPKVSFRSFGYVVSGAYDTKFQVSTYVSNSEELLISFLC